MTSVTLSILGDPRGKGAARATVRGSFGSIYKDPATRAYERLFSTAARVKMGSAPPFEGPLLLEMVAYFPIVKSSRKRDIPAMIEGWIRPTKKPDLSNILKSAEDGLKGIVFVDDAQVVEIRTRKVYAHEPRVWIRITEWSPTQ